MVDDSLKDKEIFKQIDNIDDITRIESERELILNNSRSSINDSSNDSSCHPIGLNYFNYEFFKNNVYGSSLIENGFKTNIYSSFFIPNVKFLQKNKTYTIFFDSLKYGDNPNTQFSGSIAIRKNGSNIIRYCHSGDSFTIPSDANTVQIYFYGANPANDDNYYEFTNIMIVEGVYTSRPSYEPYDGCLYGLELYDMIEPNFITSNYYVNCGIIAIFLALIVILVNAPFLFIRKVKGD